MKKKYKHIEFELSHGRWFCYNIKIGNELALIYYYSPWKKFVLEMQPDCVFDLSCLKDVTHFMSQLTQEITNEQTTTT